MLWNSLKVTEHDKTHKNKARVDEKWLSHDRENENDLCEHSWHKILVLTREKDKTTAPEYTKGDQKNQTRW